MNFPIDYPNNPPKFKFINEMWHPNSESSKCFNKSLNIYKIVYRTGEVCISILTSATDPN